MCLSVVSIKRPKLQTSERSIYAYKVVKMIPGRDNIFITPYTADLIDLNKSRIFKACGIAKAHNVGHVSQRRIVWEYGIGLIHCYTKFDHNTMVHMRHMGLDSESIRVFKVRINPGVKYIRGYGNQEIAAKEIEFIEQVYK